MTKIKDRHELIKNVERITAEIANLKRMIILEFRPSGNGRNKVTWDDLQQAIKKLASRWDNITAVEEIRRQREK